MGQKTHPLAFRLGVTEEHKSIWYANFNQYGKLLKEDDKIRTYLNCLSRTAYISDIKIIRNQNGNIINLDIKTGTPSIYKTKESEVVAFDKINLEKKDLVANIKKFLPSDYKFKINIIEVKNLTAALIANLIVKDLESRILFRKVIRKAFKVAEVRNVQGIKIQISGRLNGNEIARTEWRREGRVPLQTLRADIDYCSKEAHTIYGVLGIKVWLFKSEIFNLSK